MSSCRNIRKKISISLLLLAPFFFYAQEDNDSLLIFNQKELKVSPEAETNAPLLVEELTKKKTGDKEKFKAIFGWVAYNINYDYHSYFSPGGTYSGVALTLARKSAICVGYAQLMDSLCKLANIPNVSVYGYARDYYSDVGDSMYIDNHAWNAVKLDNEWYVYDVTWSTGTPRFTMKGFNKWKYKIVSKAKPKYKIKQYKKRNRFFFTDDCGKQYSSAAFYYKQKFFNRRYLALIRRLKIKMKQEYTNAVTNKYYLCQPELFAITHFPDDPCWSLLEEKDIRKFENDSAYYYLHDSIYKKQTREGRACEACDQFVEADTYTKNHLLKNNSYSSNPKNKIIQSLCNYQQADLKYKYCLQSTDSLEQVRLIDSAIYFLGQSKLSLKQTKTSIHKEFKLLTGKNKVKLNLLLSENKKHTSQLERWTRVTLEANRDYFRATNKAKIKSRKYRKGSQALYRIIPKEPKVVPKNSEKKIAALEKMLLKNEIFADSIFQRSEQLKAEFNKEIEDLSLNIWMKVLKHDSVFYPIQKTIQLRQQLLDNYKKTVADKRSELNNTEEQYLLGLNSVVYRPAKNIVTTFNEIIKIQELRYNVERNCLGLKKQLLKYGEGSEEDFKSYRKNFLNRRKDDYCWIENYLPHIKSISKGFELLRYCQLRVKSIIQTENHTERIRYHNVNKEYLRRDRKHKNIVDHNLRSTRLLAKVYITKKRSISNPKKRKK